MVVGRDAILAGSPRFSGAVQVRLKKDVKSNGASPDKGKTWLISIPHTVKRGLIETVTYRNVFSFFQILG